MGLFTWVLFGLMAGVLAKAIMLGHDPGGGIVTPLLGIVGSVVGGLLGTAIGLGTADGFDLRSLTIAIGGGTAVLMAYRLASREVAVRCAAGPAVQRRFSPLCENEGTRRFHTDA